MSLKSFSQSPYFDDYETNDVESSKYLRILFRPGRSVQVREMNQMQTLVQQQIDRFGRAIFKEGTPVIDGRTTFDPDLYSVTIELGDISPRTWDTEFLDQITQLAQGNIKADVLDYEQVSGDTYKFYIRYSSADQDSVGDNIESFDVDSAAADITVPLGITDDAVQVISIGGSVGTPTAGSWAAGVFVQQGIFFINGEFVLVDEDAVFIDKATRAEEISGYAAFEITESIITEADDSNLLDNANGEPNVNAPGAHRYALNTTLKFFEDGGAAPTKQITRLLTISGSAVATPSRTEFSQLDRIFAQRTFEESGSYTVQPFQLDLREAYNDGSNRGKYTSAQLTDLGETTAWGEARFVAGLEPAVAYVKGFRVEPQGKQEAIVEKARTTGDFNDLILSATQGNYFEAANTGISDFTDLLDHNITHNLIESASAGATIGTCQIRSIERTGLAGDRALRVYIYNLQLNTGKKISDIGSIDLNGTNGTLTNSGGFRLIDADKNTALFQLPYKTIKSVLLDGADPVIRYRTRRVFEDQTVDSANVVTLSAPTNSVFVDDGLVDYFIPGCDVDNVNIISNGTQVELSLSSASSVPSDGTVDVLATVRFDGVSPKTKTLTTNESKSFLSTTLSNGDTFELNHTDIKRIVSITWGSVDITDDFNLDNGQRDSFYRKGKVTYTGADYSVADDLVITYDYYAHSGTAPYFSVDSYASFDYADIPTFKGVSLSDVIDFRPFIDNANDLHVDPNSIIEIDVEAYLPRKDKVCIDIFGNLVTVKGNPDYEPVEPKTPDNTLLLYNLNVPAYTFAASDITISYVDNKRFTMRDIGAIENRVKNLEYYTALSLLEKQADNKPILDPDGTNRIKNGIVTDAFVGHSIGNVASPAYAAAVERSKGELRPTYTSNSVRMPIDESSSSSTSNVGVTKTVHLGYTHTEIIDQPFASQNISVNPYDIANWGGEIELSPSSDEWKSVVRRPDVVINTEGENDAIEFLLNEADVFGTEWNEWTTNWSTTSRRIGRGFRNRQFSVTTRTSNQSREGIQRSLAFSEVNQSLGDNIIDLSFVPFIRSRKVYFKAEGLKPNTRVYPFFDGEDISAYTKEEAYVEFATSSDVTTYENLTDSDPSITSTDLVSNASGIIEGSFIIPNNDALRFRTGQRLFRLSSSPTNDQSSETTSAEATYTASGFIETRQERILSTRQPQIQRRTVTDTREVTNSTTRWVDPLAQSILIGNVPEGVFASKIDLFFSSAPTDEIPVSIHLVTVENGQPTQNIIPFSKVTKYPADLASNALSDDASVSTPFEFDTPIYLEPGVEYAIVITSNSTDWRTWISKVGETDVTTLDTISKNPYAGVFFKSANSSTWTPDQNADLKFKLYRAEFNTSGVAEFNHIMPDGVTTFDMSTFNMFLQDMIPEGTSVSYTLTIGSKNYVIEPNRNFNLLNPVTVTAGSVLKLVANIATTNTKLSPIIDLDRSSLLCIDNIVNNVSTNEDTEEAGGATARYITREVELNNASDKLSIFLDVNRPSDVSNVLVYAKVKTDDTPFDEIDWTLINPNDVIPVNSDPSSFAEAEYELDANEFTSFAIKIVMLSSNKALVPRCKDLRAIATL